MSTYPMGGVLPQYATYIGEFIPANNTVQYFYRVIAYDRSRQPLTNVADLPVSAFGPTKLDEQHVILIRWSPVIGASLFQVFKSSTGDPGSTEPSFWIASASETGIADCGYPAGTRGYDLNLGMSPVFTRTTQVPAPMPTCPEGENPCPPDAPTE